MRPTRRQVCPSRDCAIGLHRPAARRLPLARTLSHSLTMRGDAPPEGEPHRLDREGGHQRPRHEPTLANWPDDVTAAARGRHQIPEDLLGRCLVALAQP